MNRPHPAGDPPADASAGPLPAAADRDLDVPPAILDELRAICAGLPQALEEPAWAGTRWRIGTRTFAHVLMVVGGWPPVYARAIGNDGPACVLTFRSAGDDLEALTAIGDPFFRPVWGTRWTPHVMGTTITADTDWDEIAELITESFRLLAPKRLAAQLTDRLPARADTDDTDAGA